MFLSGEQIESTKSILDRVVDYVCTPCYQPSDKEAVTFQALGVSRSTIEAFWNVFCRINTSLSREISRREFLIYFKFDTGSPQNVNRCFEYFDTTGGGAIDFLEFVVSIWNICTLKIDTLTNFAFDMYDLDSDGLLSLPEIERMVEEVYGKNLSFPGAEVLSDVNSFAAERGGVLDLAAFTVYTQNHSLLLFPIFNIQRTIQHGVMGLSYWRNLENMRPIARKNKRTTTRSSFNFDYRHVRMLLRTGGMADIISNGETVYSNLNSETENRFTNSNGRIKYEKLKIAVDKIKSLSNEQRGKLKRLQIKGRQDVENAIDTVTDLGIKTKKTLVRLVSLLHERIDRNKIVRSDSCPSRISENLSSIKNTIQPKVIELQEDHDADPHQEDNRVIGIQRHKDKRRKTAKISSATKEASKISFAMNPRSRTAGVIAHYE